MLYARVTAAALAAAMLVGVPALAQTTDGAMASKDKMMGKKMSKSQMAMMNKCKGMAHEMMMKNRSCAKMMKMHPEMMSNGN